MSRDYTIRDGGARRFEETVEAARQQSLVDDVEQRNDGIYLRLGSVDLVVSTREQAAGVLERAMMIRLEAYAECARRLSLS